MEAGEKDPFARFMKTRTQASETAEGKSLIGRTKAYFNKTLHQRSIKNPIFNVRVGGAALPSQYC
jgi:hypothetical protein